MARLILKDFIGITDAERQYGPFKVFAEVNIIDSFQNRRPIFRGLLGIETENGEISSQPESDESFQIENENLPEDGPLNCIAEDIDIFKDVFISSEPYPDINTENPTDYEYFDLTVKKSDPSNYIGQSNYARMELENSVHVKEDLGIQQIDCPENSFVGGSDLDQNYDEIDVGLEDVMSRNPFLSDMNDLNMQMCENSEDLSSFSEDMYSGKQLRRSVIRCKKFRYKDEAECSLCQKKCKSLNALNHHMLVHSEERPYACDVCKKAFKEQPTLRRHMWTHMAKQHQCDICKKYFVEKSSLRRHMSTIHADYRPGLKNNQINSRQQHNCSKCGKGFKSLVKYNMHEKMHGNPNYECKTCGKVYAGRSHLKIHQRIHTGEKPFYCDTCGTRFAFKHVLKSHQARIHQNVSSLTCNICYSTFEKKSDLADHASSHLMNMKKMKNTYTIKKPYKPNEVEYSTLKNNTNGPSVFSQFVGLSSEMNCKNSDTLLSPATSYENFEETYSKLCRALTDHESKDKKCQTCNKEFERIGDLKRHIISHAVQVVMARKQETNAKTKFDCGVCSASYEEVGKFKAHLRDHAQLTLYKCAFCDRTFGDSSNYSKHKKIHGDQYLQCDICKRKFNTKRMLISHMEYHKSTSPFYCDLCKKEFHFMSTLKKHIKIAHCNRSNDIKKCDLCPLTFQSVELKQEHQLLEHAEQAM